MDIPIGAPEGKKRKTTNPIIKPTFAVATWAAVGLRAYFDSNNTPQWLFERVHQQLHGRSEGGVYLRRNQDSFKQTLSEFGVPESDFGYKGADRTHNDLEPWADHTLTSRALVLYLFFQVKHRTTPSIGKKAAMDLLQRMVSSISTELGEAGVGSLGLTIEDDFGVLRRNFLGFSAQGVTSDWARLAHLNSAATTVWETLRDQPWCGMKVTSSLGSATLQDILLFMFYIHAHPKLTICNLMPYNTVCKHALPELVLWLGSLLDLYAQQLSEKPLGALPLLTTRDGKNKRKADEVNKFVLLNKLKDQTSSRRRVAKTHTELVVPCSNMVDKEAHVTVAIYIEKLKHEFESYLVKQFSIAWDPSSYGGQQTLVSTIYSPFTEAAGYMPNQMLRRVVFGDLHDSILV